MEEHSRYAVGLDIGTSTVRCVVGHIDGATGTPTIVGLGSAPNSGMRKGTVVNLNGPAQAIDTALGEAERMSGYQVDGASLSINGAHILSTKADGMIAVGTTDHQVNQLDIVRLEEVATVGKVPANREVLDLVPHSFRLDGQDNIKDPLGMTGTRLEINANVVSALVPYLQNLQKSSEMAKVLPHTIMPSVLSSGRAVLSEQQMENGVAVVDMGASTTGVAIYEDGDLQYVAVVPYGGMNITNDLAIGLKTDPEVAEKVKVAHGVAVSRDVGSTVTVKHDDQSHSFSTTEIDEIVEARLDEIFDAVQAECKKAGRAGRLPSGVVLTGGGANLKQIAEYAKEKLGLAARVGKAKGYGGVADNIEDPQFASAIGLMLVDAEASYHGKAQGSHGITHNKDTATKAMKSAGGVVSKFFGRFKA